jgi:hypothetical protein
MVAKKTAVFEHLSDLRCNINVLQRSLILHHRLKGHGYKQIHPKLVATSERNAYTEDSLKCWVREHDGGRSDRTDFSKTGSTYSDIAAAVSKVLGDYLLISKKNIAAQLRTSRALVKGIFIEVSGMKTFSFQPA